jgi:hypothetical protein
MIKVLSQYVTQTFKLVTICTVLACVVLFSGKETERVGDKLQVALPLLGFGCSIVNGQAFEYFSRFVVMEIVLHGSKNALGDMPINQRPSGGDRGFPSGHTTAATFGASALIHDCITSNAYVKGAVVLAAAFVGGSRIEAERHTTLQVVAGVFWGWVSQNAFRRGGGLVGRMRRRYGDMVRGLRVFPVQRELLDVVASRAANISQILRNGAMLSLGLSRVAVLKGVWRRSFGGGEL